MRYSAVQNAALFASVLPLVIAWQLADTIDWYPYLLGAAVGLALAAALRGLLARWRARLHRRSAAFVAGEVAAEHAPGGFALWLAPPLWCVALGLLANAYLDGAPATEHPSEVLRQVRRSKGADYVVLRDFRSPRGELSIRAGSPGVPPLAVGEAVTLVVRPGLFGWARLVAVVPRR